MAPTTRRVATVGAGLIALLAGGATGPVAAAEPRLTHPVNATNAQDEAPGHSYTSPGVVVHPDNPLKVYAATVDVRSQRCVLLRSADGGRTWAKGKESPSPAAFPFCTHDNGLIPMSFAAIGRDNALYFLHTAWDTQDGGRSENRSVFLARSTDEGDTWVHTPVNINRGKTGNDIEKNLPLGLAVDTRGSEDVVYATYRASWPNPAAPAATRPGQMFVATSTDSGKSFAKPVSVSDAFLSEPANLPSSVADAQRKKENFGSSAGIGIGLDDKGTIFLPWQRSTANITPTAPASPYYIATSTDQGKTFTMTEALPADEDQLNPSGPTLIWGTGGGPSGTLHFVWEGKPKLTQGDRDILYRRSTDGARTWSETQTLNDDDPAQLFSQHQPGISVAPNGRVDIAWWDQRDGNGRYVTDVYATRSADFGVSWSKNERITDVSVNRLIGMWTPGTGGDVRQPPGVGSTNALTFYVWDDTRNGNKQTETQDLYAATAQLESLQSSGLPTGAGYALAAVTGVAVVGLLLFATSLVTRSRRPPPPPTPRAEADRTPAEVS